MRFVCFAVVVCVAFVVAQDAGAGPAWEKRLGDKIKKVEVDVAKLDGTEADRSVAVDLRILALDKRVASLEKARGIEVVHADVKGSTGLVDLGSRSAAIVQIAGRVRRVKKHDNPPEVTPSDRPRPKPDVKATPGAKDEESVEWPEVVQIAATASLDYVEIGEWLYGSTRRSRYINNEYLHTSYEGNLHFAIRLKGLKEQVRSVDFRVFVTGRTGPFRISKPVMYEIEWKAKHRHMWNGAKKNWNHHDQWTQRVGAVWIRGPRNKNVKPRVEAYLTRVVTDKGRILEFKLPRKHRER